MTDTWRVVVVDDHPVFRDGLAGLLAMLPDVTIAGAHGTAEDALAHLTDTRPDVVLMDINLPGMSGVDATRQILKLSPRTAVLALTMVEDDDTVLAAIAAGARGYMLKGASASEIAAALQTVAAGGAAFGAGIAGPLLARTPPATTGRSPQAQEGLTAREVEVLSHMADGATNRQIARAMGLSLKTIQNHVSRILDKLQVPDRVQAIARARRMALPSPQRKSSRASRADPP